MKSKIHELKNSIRILSKKVFTKTALILLMAAGILNSCTKEQQGINSNMKTFSLQKFRTNIIYQLHTSSPTEPQGYSFIVNQNGMLADSFSWGIANYDARTGDGIPMTTKTEINIASVTKYFTAIGVIKLLGEKGLTVDSKIKFYLPAYWNAKTAVKDLTFKELMTHSSGFTESNTSWDSLRVTCGRGLDDPGKSFNVYSNMNFAIFRAIIPFLRDQGNAVANEVNMNQADFEDWMEEEYLDFMQDEVFSPAGVFSVICQPTASKMLSLGFSESNANPKSITSWNPGNWTSICGGGGYYMTTMQMAQTFANIEHTNNILSQAQKNQMDQFYMGWDISGSPMTYSGRAYGKGGALRSDPNSNGILDAGEPGLQTYVIKYQNNVELTLVINSVPGPYRDVDAMMLTAYNNAWE